MSEEGEVEEDEESLTDAAIRGVCVRAGAGAAFFNQDNSSSMAARFEFGKEQHLKGNSERGWIIYIVITIVIVTHTKPGFGKEKRAHSIHTRNVGFLVE